MMLTRIMLKSLGAIRFGFLAVYPKPKLALAKLVLSSIAFTTLTFATPAIGDVFVGAKAGNMMVDVSSGDDPINVAANIGYELDSRLADLSLVGEINRTIDKGSTRQGEDLEFESNAIFLVWKTTGSLFVTLRGGVAQTKTITGGNSDKHNGVLLGGSLGTVIGRTRLQLEYTSHAGDANYFGIGMEIGICEN